MNTELYAYEVMNREGEILLQTWSTKRDGELYEEYLSCVKDPPIALVVKLADIRDNMSPLRHCKLPPDKQIKLKAKYLHALAILTKKMIHYEG